MFTGIIEEVGKIAAVRDLGGGRRLSVEARMTPELRPDESVSVNGVCQTVVAVESSTFEVVGEEDDDVGRAAACRGGFGGAAGQQQAQ